MVLGSVHTQHFSTVLPFRVSSLVSVRRSFASQVTFASLHRIAVHAVTSLNFPSGPHVTVPPPEKPSSHVTVNFSPVLPLITLVPVPLLFSELATSLGAHALGVHAVPVNFPSVPPHVHVPPPLYPSLHVTSTVSSVLPVRLPESLLSEWATCVAAHALGVHAVPVNFPSVPHVHVPSPEYPSLHVTSFV